MGDGPVGADAEIASDELDADHRARFESGARSHGGGNAAAAGDSLGWLESEGAELGREAVDSSAGESAEGDGRGDVDHLAGPEASFIALGKRGEQVGRGEADR